MWISEYDYYMSINTQPEFNTGIAVWWYENQTLGHGFAAYHFQNIGIYKHSAVNRWKQLP